MESFKKSLRSEDRRQAGDFEVPVGAPRETDWRRRARGEGGEGARRKQQAGEGRGGDGEAVLEAARGVRVAAEADDAADEAARQQPDEQRPAQQADEGASTRAGAEDGDGAEVREGEHLEEGRFEQSRPAEPVAEEGKKDVCLDTNSLSAFAAHYVP
ncbi:unnamed protein product [Mesocestoides corti]|uniref:Uncharacterized protein n=1 Tax=Mesocestoides corti TaxID=53468 RepID=A0A0R3UMJ8_MESCO|nr:unnamed protein product [Mesocestoides corti]